MYMLGPKVTEVNKIQAMIQATKDVWYIFKIVCIFLTVLFLCGIVALGLANLVFYSVWIALLAVIITVWLAKFYWYIKKR